MADHIEREWSHYAVQAPSLSVHGHAPPMSMMLAAELAGLGTRSFAAHIILNPEYGLLYYAALITTLPLTPDPPLAEPACPHPGCVAMYRRIGTTPCLRVCPGCLFGTIGADGRIAVLGVLIASGAENPNLDGLLAAAPARGGEERELHGRLDPADLVPPGKAYRYRGSLTTPPCTENVRWTVLAQPLTLSPGEIAAFTRLYRGDNRPLQPLNGRELFIVG